MSDETPKKRDLSEISHLFLSSVRDRQTGGMPRPQRTPPPRKNDLSIDLTPEEFAQVMGGNASEPMSDAPMALPPVRAVLGAHLNGKQFDRVKQYARHLASQVGRVGLIELDASEFRLMCFDPSGSATAQLETPESAECYEPRQMAEALGEMNCDVNQWLLLLPSPRTPEARALLRQARHWVLLSTCDHDGIVSSYRLLKGLAEPGAARPSLSLALLESRDEAETTRVFRKLSGVCQQFLNWALEVESPVRLVPGVSEHLAIYCRPTRDKAQMASAPQWDIVSAFLNQSHDSSATAPEAPLAETEVEMTVLEAETDSGRATVAEVIIPTPPANPPARPAPMPAPPVMPAGHVSAAAPASTRIAEIIDIGQEAGPEEILSAMMGQSDSGLLECPLRPPMCAQARLAVNREREIVLLAIATEGLSDLRQIGRAYQWLIENQTLIAMAVPQLAVDLNRPVSLRLLVDQADARAELLQPLLRNDQVSVHAYRHVRWAGRSGLLLEAA